MSYDGSNNEKKTRKFKQDSDLKALAESSLFFTCKITVTGKKRVPHKMPLCFRHGLFGLNPINWKLINLLTSFL